MDENFFEPLEPETRAALMGGDGKELSGSPAKM
jgi:hypothetical protein